MRRGGAFVPRNLRIGGLCYAIGNLLECSGLGRCLGIDLVDDGCDGCRVGDGAWRGRDVALEQRCDGRGVRGVAERADRRVRVGDARRARARELAHGHPLGLSAWNRRHKRHAGIALRVHVQRAVGFRERGLVRPLLREVERRELELTRQRRARFRVSLLGRQVQAVRWIREHGGRRRYLCRVERSRALRRRGRAGGGCRGIRCRLLRRRGGIGLWRGLRGRLLRGPRQQHTRAGDTAAEHAADRRADAGRLWHALHQRAVRVDRLRAEVLADLLGAFLDELLGRFLAHAARELLRASGRQHAGTTRARERSTEDVGLERRSDLARERRQRRSDGARLEASLVLDGCARVLGRLARGDALAVLLAERAHRRFLHVADGDDLEGNAADIKGQRKPVTIGKCFHVPLTIVNTQTLIGGVHWSKTGSPAALSYSAIYDQALALADDGDDANVATLAAATITLDYRTCEAQGLARLDATPNGTVTADVVEGATSGDRTAAQCAKRAITNYAIGFTPTFDDDSFDDLDAADSSEVGNHSDGSDTLYQFCADLLFSVDAALLVDNNLNFYVKQLTDPSAGVSIATITENDIVDNGAGLEQVDISDETNGIPSYKTTTLYKRYFHQFIDNDLAGSLTDAQRNDVLSEWRRSNIAETSSVQNVNKSSQPLELPSLLTAASDANTRNTARHNLRKVDRTMWILPLSRATTFNIGDIITVQVDRFGMQSGKKFIILGYEIPELTEAKTEYLIYG